MRPRLYQKTYSYYICDETFDSTGRKSAWLTLIERAFTAWDTATDNLVTTVRVTPTPLPPGVTHPPGVAKSGCGDRLALTQEIVDKVRQEIMSRTPTGTPTRTPTPGEYIAGHFIGPMGLDTQALLKQLQLGTGITGTSVSQFQGRANSINEVLMYNDSDPSLVDFKDAAVFRELGGILGYAGYCWYNMGQWDDRVMACTIGRVIGNVDVIIRRKPFENEPWEFRGIPCASIPAAASDLSDLKVAPLHGIPPAHMRPYCTKQAIHSGFGATL